MATFSTLPAINRTLLAAFSAYTNWSLRRNFHRIAMGGLSACESVSGRPFVCYCNHPSWWDPLAGLLLCRRFFGERKSYAPIDATALTRYGFFKQLGFFGVRQDHISGARTLLSVGESVLSQQDGALWITPQGQMQDVRIRPVTLQPGLAHLCLKCPDAMAMPMAFEYPFGLERKPEVLVWLGQPIRCGDLGKTAREANATLAENLSLTMDTLSTKWLSRDEAAFDWVIEGSAGTDIFYDTWQRMKAFATGKKYVDEHASVVSIKTVTRPK